MTESRAAENTEAVDAHALAELNRLRGSIDNIDAAIVHMLEHFLEHDAPAPDPTWKTLLSKA